MTECDGTCYNDPANCLATPAPCLCDECNGVTKPPSKRELAAMLSATNDEIDRMLKRIESLERLAHTPCAGPHYYQPTTWPGSLPAAWPTYPTW